MYSKISCDTFYQRSVVERGEYQHLTTICDSRVISFLRVRAVLGIHIHTTEVYSLTMLFCTTSEAKTAPKFSVMLQ